MCMLMERDPCVGSFFSSFGLFVNISVNVAMRVSVLVVAAAWVSHAADAQYASAVSSRKTIPTLCESL